jgi:general stress protein 26
MEKQNAELKKFTDLVTTVRICSLVTHSENDVMKGRPMSVSEVDDFGNLWFFTNEFTEKVDEISKNNEVLLTFAQPSDNLYVMVNGSASLVSDRARIVELWNPALKAWFPDGLEDANMKLLKVEPNEVEYWTGSSSKLVVAFKMLQALVKGEQYSDGEHKKINIP